MLSLIRSSAMKTQSILTKTCLKPSLAKSSDLPNDNASIKMTMNEHSLCFFFSFFCPLKTRSYFCQKNQMAASTDKKSTVKSVSDLKAIVAGMSHEMLLEFHDQSWSFD